MHPGAQGEGSTDLTKAFRCDQLSTEEWKRRVVDGTWGLHTPRPALGLKVPLLFFGFFLMAALSFAFLCLLFNGCSQLSSHHLLVYKQPLPDHCLSKTHTVFVSMTSLVYYLTISSNLIQQAGVLVSPLASLGDSVHPRLTLGAPGRELDQQLSLGSTGGEKKTPVEALLLDLPVISLPSHLVHQARSRVCLFQVNLNVPGQRMGHASARGG